MRRFSVFLLAAVLALSLAACSDTAEEKAAINAANQWLALIDVGRYAASWDEAASLFKNTASKEQWTEKLKSSRAPLGKVESRKLKTASYKTILRGASEGKYVVIRFNSSFENEKEAIETVTPMLDKDGQWRVLGYNIK
jgi:uncharacterized protein DUF4019